MMTHRIWIVKVYEYIGDSVHTLSQIHTPHLKSALEYAYMVNEFKDNDVRVSVKSRNIQARIVDINRPMKLICPNCGKRLKLAPRCPECGQLFDTFDKF